MNYQQAEEKLEGSDCVALSQPHTRLRRETPHCIALYYNGLPILKWIDDDTVIIHRRGNSLTSAACDRIRLYLPECTGIYDYVSSFTIYLRGAGARGPLSGGLRYNTKTHSVERLA